jgi:hypothetical protein
MDKETRNLLANTTQAVRRALEEEFRLQLEGIFDVHEDGRIEAQPGAPLDDKQKLVRRKIISAIEHRRSMGESEAESVHGFLREAAFTLLNRLAALKMMEARGIVLECVSACGWRDAKQDTEAAFEARGFKEFSGLAPGLIELPDKGYRLYLECLFDEIGREVGVLFDRTDSASLLWPRRKALADALTRINAPGLASIWSEDETIGWIYQYYNDPAERRQMRDESAAPRNSREMAVRNQFFTPRYVVEFLTDNALGRLWHEMTKGQSQLKERCRYLIRQTSEVFLNEGENAPTADMEAASADADLQQRSLHIAHRPLKDPREIRMLDPACGSMHFGLYTFDLLEVIYSEAWDMQVGVVGRGRLAEGSDRYGEPSSQLPGSDRLAESHGSGRSHLHPQPDLPEGGTVRPDQSDPKGSSVSALEHCRGAGPENARGIPAIPLSGARLPEGSGNPDRDRPSSTIHQQSGRGFRSDPGVGSGTPQPVGTTHRILPSALCLLTTHRGRTS